MESFELDRQEVLSYYDKFYSSEDFKYYSDRITKRFFRGVFSKCGVRPTGKILDVGCGTGYYCNIFHELGFEPVGIDFSTTAIEKAKEKYPSLEFHVGDALNLPFAPSSFDVVLSYGCSVVSTYDLGQIHSYVRHLRSFVKPGGWLLLIGGSNLSGNRLTTSTWLSHTWEDLRRFIPECNWRSLGPFLSHVRLVSIVGSLALGSAVTFLLRHAGSNLVRTTFHFVQKA
ncbi:MAG: class I SAM-dependent methyltransferase [Bacteroidota bacterium]